MTDDLKRVKVHAPRPLPGSRDIVGTVISDVPASSRREFCQSLFG